jgi:hypothetical protein
MLYIRREKNKYRTINKNNEEIARAVNGFTALTARSILVSAHK